MAVRQSDTICAVATGRGDASVAMIRLSGEDALRLIGKATGVPRFVPRRMTLARIIDPRSGRELDRAMVCVMPSPRSYTGEDVVEVFAHGGQYNVSSLLELFIALGARQAAPGEFTRRAFVNGRIDLTQAEAVADVIAARSARALTNAQALLEGALGRRVRALRRETIDLTADLEACLDFAEDVESPVSQAELMHRHRSLIEAFNGLVQSYEQGRGLHGISVALIGRVNAGKSSLFNALQGVTRALVSEEAGTTRDYLEAHLEWDGQAITLVDTAGRRPTPEMSALERAGDELGRERAGRCDIVVEVIDIAGFNGSERERLSAGSTQLLAANKADLLNVDLLNAVQCGRIRADLTRYAGCPVVMTSATTGAGIAELRQAILNAIGASEGMEAPQETFQLTQSRHRDALKQAEVALGSGLVMLEQGGATELIIEHARAALEALGSITGETYSEEILDAVFSRFCVGK